MSHWPRQEIRARISSPSGPLVQNTAPMDSSEFAECLQPDSLDLRIGIVVAGGLEKVQRQGDPPFQLPPGEMAAIITMEIVNIPPDVAAEVSPRLSLLNDGLLALTAPHVDPGYSGPLTARVINLLDRPYRLSFGSPVLTIRFYELKSATDRPCRDKVSMKEKTERALKESRDTFNRLFLREEDIVLKKELRSAAIVQALQWLSLLVPAVAVVLPFSVPFFWNLGTRLSLQQPWLVFPVVIVAGLILLPLFVLYLRSVGRLWRLFDKG